MIESKVEDKWQKSPMESCLEDRDNCIESLKRSLTDQCHLENLKYKEKYVITQVHMECWSGENAVYLN